MNETAALGMFDRITFDPEMMGGRACMRGTRITVGHVVRLVAEGASHEEIVTDFPFLEAEDVQQALEYATWLAREEVFSA
jgi:uncharacterized protein (DUF433 family)